MKAGIGYCGLHYATDYCPSLPLPCPGGDYSIPGLVLAGEEEEFSLLGAISVR